MVNKSWPHHWCSVRSHLPNPFARMLLDLCCRSAKKPRRKNLLFPLAVVKVLPEHLADNPEAWAFANARPGQRPRSITSTS